MKRKECPARVQGDTCRCVFKAGHKNPHKCIYGAKYEGHKWRMPKPKEK